jgi:hypothetical protein
LGGWVLPPPVIVYHFAECLRIFSIYYCQIISPKAYQNLGSTIYGTIKTLRCVYELITQHVALREAAAELDDFFVTQQYRYVCACVHTYYTTYDNDTSPAKDMEWVVEDDKDDVLGAIWVDKVGEYQSEVVLFVDS